MAVATNPLTYNGYITQVATLAIVNTQTVSGVVQGVDAAFNSLIPQMLNYAELRIQRDLDLLPSQTQNTSYSLTAGNNMLQINVNDFVTLQTVSVTANGTTTPLLSTSKTYIQNVYPDAASAGIPQYFAMYGGDATTYGNTYNNIIVGPWPSNTYPVVLTGTQRLQSLYANSTTALAGTATTFISTYLPELLVQASLIYVSQYQRNFGPASNDPQMGPSYEAQYQNLLKGAITEEYRKKFQASAWSSVSSSPVGTPSRSV
jgi:hypothetical protein